MRRPRPGREGFTLFVVIMLVAILAMAGMSLLNLIRVDLSLVGQSRSNIVARELAEGGLMEIINDGALPATAPSISSPSLSVPYPPPAGSRFVDPAEAKTYTGEVNLLRLVPLSESSQGLTRAVVYEVGVTSSYRDGQSTAELNAEIYRVVSWAPGTVLPSRHYR